MTNYSSRSPIENRKVYVGWPVFTPDPKVSTEELRLLPAVSSYRDERDLPLIFTRACYEFD